MPMGCKRMCRYDGRVMFILIINLPITCNEMSMRAVI